MAEERYLSIYPGETENTYDTVYFSFEAGVTDKQAGTYFIRYQVGSKSKVDTASFYISAGGTYTTYEFHQSGLSPGTSYKINATLYVKANSTAVATAQLIVSTDSAQTYYGKVILDGNGGTYGNNLTTTTFHGSVTSVSSSADIPIAYADPGFTKTSKKLLGFSTSKSATSNYLPTSGTYTVTSSETSSSSPETVRLYAVWGDAIPSEFSWTSTIGGTLELTPIGGNLYAIYPLTAKEWNNRFLSCIAEWAKLRGVSLSSTTIQKAQASQGNDMKASQAAAAVDLLSALNPPTKPPTAPSQDGFITTTFINGLATSLNSMRELYE